jgi:hypothetical protein
MKRLIILIALLYVVPCYALEPIDFSKTYALTGAIQAVVGAGGAAVSCTTDVSLNQTPTDTWTIGDAAAVWASGQFTTGSGVTSITMVTVKMKRTNDNANSDTLTGYIYTNSSDKPSTLVSNATSTNTHSWSEVNISTFTDLKFCFTNVTVSGSTVYSFVMKRSAANATNLFAWGKQASGTSNYVAWGTDGSSWTNYQPYYITMLTSYGSCTCP